MHRFLPLDRATFPYQKAQSPGFTLIEMLVVISIIGILLVVVYASFTASGAQGRDLERQAELREVATALEAYKRREGQYPSGCNATGWSSEGDCVDYIADGFVPRYINELPTDPRLGTGDGFSYRTNPEGTVYKLMVSGTVEGESVTADHDLAPCDTGSCSPGDCDPSTPLFETSYAVWNGFAAGADAGAVLSSTADVICKM